MIVVLSYIFAFILTMIIACVMYPIAAIFFVFGKIGYFVDKISRVVFSAVNRVIRYLWSDLANSTIIKQDKIGTINSCETKSVESNTQES